MNDPKPAWHSVHLFVAAERDLDALALEAGSWMADQKVGSSRPWFFIRYMEGGPHLRLRAKADDDEAWSSLKRHMTDVCAKLARGKEPDQWARAVTTPTRRGEVHAPGQAVEMAYEPETIRYGGEEALAVHEDLFATSSAIATEVVRRTGHNSGDRVGAAMRLTLDTLAGLLGLEADPRRYMAEYAASWRGAWADNIEKPRTVGFDVEASYRERASRPDGELPKTISGKWIGALREARRRLDEISRRGAMISPMSGERAEGDDPIRSAMASMTHSQIHMLNNRLGLWPNVEIAMAEALATSNGES
ncbi:MAG TPA: lantibiotic dehydratase C-terminal domain-containing protein [Allosphingosinicella sp.]|jgi:thiopeptide-type bacteriocin biosynthesis protein